jgi:hypothetical protein
MIALLKEYADCFAWDYMEMPRLDRSIVEHQLPLKKGFRPFQQRARQMKAEVLEEVKKEVEKMLEAGFIRPCRYAEWISSVVPVQKKDGLWRVCVDFRDLNRAIPKDEYPMPVVETLINAVAGHKILSFMDGNAGYNQIFMAPEDIHKTTFRVPGAVGLFVWQNRLNYSSSSVLDIAIQPILPHTLQTEQPIGLSGLRPMQPWFNRIEEGLARTKASLQSYNSSPTFNS